VSALNLYKLVVRDKNGQVQQIHECYRDEVEGRIVEETEKGFSVTATLLEKNKIVRPESCGVSGYKD
jgi:hypothetical protein